ncbi:MAG: hypothetical protein Q7I92_07145, partial [Humidesulfovibrio sp.]|nr:hypothetical protein [Humidesulfovibrio sp.]
LRTYFEIERTPLESAIIVSALSQMWIYNVYEVIRVWRNRKNEFEKLKSNCGIPCKLKCMPDDDIGNISIAVRRSQLERFNEDNTYLEEISAAWVKLEPVFELVTLFRINLAKHCAPGKDNIHPRAPGYGRIDMECGAMNYELINRHGHYTYLNRRDIADTLRASLMGS